jgi:hypothetical protein
MVVLKQEGADVTARDFAIVERELGSTTPPRIIPSGSAK